MMNTIDYEVCILKNAFLCNGIIQRQAQILNYMYSPVETKLEQKNACLCSENFT